MQQGTDFYSHFESFCMTLAVSHPILGILLYAAGIAVVGFISYCFFCYGVRCIRAFFNI